MAACGSSRSAGLRRIQKGVDGLPEGGGALLRAAMAYVRQDEQMRAGDHPHERFGVEPRDQLLVRAIGDVSIRREFDESPRQYRNQDLSP